MKLLIVFFLLIFSSVIHAQNPFVGKLVYTVQIADTAMRDMFQTSTMTIFTNDTLIRVETSTESLGKQVLIQHLSKKKAYLLVETPMGKFAIQIPEDSTTNKYSFKKSKGNSIIAGLECKKVSVSNSSLHEKLTYSYSPLFEAKYLPGFESFPGLLTDYYVVSKDGLYHHQLIEIKQERVSNDLFGIPTDYKRISMTGFVDEMTQGQSTFDVEEEK